MLARATLALLTLSSAVSVATSGDAKVVRGSSHDAVDPDTQGFLAVFQLTAAGGTSPTLDAVVQTSWDGGTTWHTVASMTQLSGAGDSNEVKVIANMGPLVRATITPGGTANPDVTGEIYLASSGTIQ